MRTPFIACILCLPVLGFGFQEPVKDSVQSWSHTMVSALTFTQVSYSNWVQGGQNSLAYTLSVEGKSERDDSTLNWANSYKFAFGQARLGGGGLRKTDDKIDLQSVLTYQWGSLLNPYVAATLKSQFAEGVTYDDRGIATPVSAMFDPVYLTQSVGFGYQPVPQIKTRLGAAMREILTSRYTAYSDDPGTAKVEKTKVDGGIESVTEIEWKLEENILLTAKLELFAPLKNFDQVVVRGDNTLSLKVSKYIVVNLNVQWINETQVTPRTQVKETLAIGLSYTLL